VCEGFYYDSAPTRAEAVNAITGGATGGAFVLMDFNSQTR
jgi:hypothetical protein